MLNYMLVNLKNRFPVLVSKKKGQGMVEYALLVGLIAIVVIVVLVTLGGKITAKFQEIVNAL